MKVNRLHEGHTRLVLPAATLPQCTCDAFKADLKAGAYVMEL